MAGTTHLEKLKRIPATSILIPYFSFSPDPQVCSESINPFYDADQINNWCFEFLGLKPTDSDLKLKVEEQNLGLAAAMCYPTTVSRSSLTLISKFLAWLFLADDALEDMETCSTDIKNLSTAYINIFDGKYMKAKGLIQNKEILHQMDMFHELWEELSSHMKKLTKDRFTNGMVEALETMKIELTWLHCKLVPNVETYLWLRRKTSAVIPCLVVLDVLQDLDIDEEAVHNPLMQKLETVGIDHVALSNDIVSFRKEWVCGKYLNIIPILACDHQFSIDEAIAKAIKMVKDAEEEYAEVIAAISSNSELVSRKGVKKYAEGVGMCMKGNSEWGWITGRYHASDRVMLNLKL